MKSFLENSVIQNILKLAYPNEDARNSYIEFENKLILKNKSKDSKTTSFIIHI